MILWDFMFFRHCGLSKSLSISDSVGVLYAVSSAPTFLFSPLTASQRLEPLAGMDWQGSERRLSESNSHTNRPRDTRTSARADGQFVPISGDNAMLAWRLNTEVVSGGAKVIA